MVVRNAPFCPRRAGSLPGWGSISLEKWTKEHQGLRPLDPWGFLWAAGCSSLIFGIGETCVLCGTTLLL